MSALAASCFAVPGLPSASGLTVTIPSAPTGLSPSGSSVSADPVLSWSPVSGATTYKVEASTDSGFGSTLFSVVTPNTNYVWTSQYPETTIYWHVDAINSAGASSYTGANFTKAAPAGPVLTSPADGATITYPTGVPTFVWQPVAGVQTYTLTVSNTASFVPGSGTTSYTTQSTSYTPTASQTIGQTYYWEVQGQFVASGVNTQVSEVRSYTLAWNSTPVLVTPPSASSTVTDVVFRWQPVLGAAKYEIQVGTNNSFANGVYIDTVIDSTNYSPPVTVTGTQNSSPPANPVSNPITGPLPTGSYWWRVRAYDNTSPTPDAGSWSAAQQFTRVTMTAPDLVWPVNGDVNVNNLVLRWKPVAYAGAYELQLGTDVNFSPNTFSTCITNHTDWTFSTNEVPTAQNPIEAIVPGPGNTGGCPLDTANLSSLVQEGVPLYWHVRGLDYSTLYQDRNKVINGQFSATRSFIYDGNAAIPTPLTPLPGASTTVPKLSWTPVRSADYYVVHVTAVSSRDGSVQNFTYKTSASSLVPSLHKQADFTYDNNGTPTPITYSVTWSVGSVSHFNQQGPTAVGNSFTLSGWDGASGTTGGTVTLTSPANAAHSATIPSFNWSAVQGADHYEFWLYPSGSLVGQVLGDQNQNSAAASYDPYTSSFTPTENSDVSPGAYQWQIVAYNGSGSAIASSARRDITIDSPALVALTGPTDCVPADALCTPEPSTPLLSWTPNPDDWAGFYRVHIASDPSFTHQVHIYDTPSTAFRSIEALPDNQASQAYYWFVQSCQGDWKVPSTAICGPFDSSVFGTYERAFQKESPAIQGMKTVSPTASVPGGSNTPCTATGSATISDQVTFCWDSPAQHWAAYPGAAGDPNGASAPEANDTVDAMTYRITVSTTADFSTVIDTAEVDQTSYTPFNKTYPEGPLYWEVQARDATTNYLTLGTGTVTKASAGLTGILPANHASVTSTPQLSWNPQAFAATYTEEVYKNDDTAFTAANKVASASTPGGGTKLTSFTPTQTLAPGTYAWRVRRTDIGNNNGPWTGPLEFTVTGTAPTLVLPINGTLFTNNSVLATWTTSPGAVKYRFQSSSSPTFGSLIENVVTTNTSWAPTSTSYPNTTIYWQVQAIDAQNNVIATSGTGNYVHDTTRPTAAITSVKGGITAVTINWTASPAPHVLGGITSFIITPYIGSTAQTPVTIPPPTPVSGVYSYTFNGLVNNTTYTFTVTPVDGNGVGTESAKSAGVAPRAYAPYTSTTNLINRVFQHLFMRNPTGTEMTTWTNNLNSGAYTQATFIQDLWGLTPPTHSTPHSQRSIPIARLYHAYFGNSRIPDEPGFSTWLIRYRTTYTLDQISQAFAKSPEFITKYGALSNTGFVDLAYENVLGETPGHIDAGAAYWINQLNTHKLNRGQVMNAIAGSPTYKAQMQNTVFAELFYLELMAVPVPNSPSTYVVGRAPTAGEVAYIKGLLDGGASVGDVAAWFVVLPEYATYAN